MPEVRSLDLDETANRVLLGVAPLSGNAVRARVYARARSAGIDTAAIAFREHDMLREANAPPDSIGGNVEWNPIVAGIRIQTGLSPCTLGIVADRAGARGFVTATHCTPRWGQLDLGPLYQPQANLNIGYESVDPSYYGCGFNVCRASDAAFFTFEPNTTRTTERGLIARTTYRNAGTHTGGRGSVVTDQNQPYFSITSVENNDVFAGQIVDKMGITSGWTAGPMRHTCSDHKLGNGTGQKVTRCVYEADVWIEGGDSGGPVFSWSGGNEVRLLGTTIGHISGVNMAFSKFSRINSDLGPLVVTR